MTLVELCNDPLLLLAIGVVTLEGVTMYVAFSDDDAIVVVVVVVVFAMISGEMIACYSLPHEDRKSVVW